MSARSLFVLWLLGACAEDPPADDLAARGQAAVARRGCPSCHDPGDGSLSGQSAPRPGTSTYGKNLTPDPDTGLGRWSDANVLRALRVGLDDDGVTLCPPMPRYPGLGDGEGASIVAYLRSLKAVRRAGIPASSCPPFRAADADAGSGGDADGGAPPVASECPPRINEVATGGRTPADEFVELYAPCDAPVDLEGSALVYRSPIGTRDLVLAHLSGSLPPQTFLVIGSSAFPGGAAARFRATLSAEGGGLGWRDASGVVRDALGWGSATNGLARGTPAVAPPPGSSLQRYPDGADSGDSARDFRIGRPTPGAANGPG
jgi:hypothetical protein